MSKFRQNINIELADGAKEQLEEIRTRTGMTQKELVARLIDWFASQDRVVQQIILRQIPDEIAADVAKMMLEKMSREASEFRAAAAPPVSLTTREQRRSVATAH